jgi:hypothetical protein
MLDEAAITETQPPPPADEARLPALEQRVRHLEDVVAGLQDTRALEERVVERVTAQVTPVQPNGVRESAGRLLDAGRTLLPAAVAAVAATASAVAPPEPEPRAAVPTSAPLRRPYLLFDIYAEFRAVLRMYLDPRFRLTWAARVAPLVLLAAIATSWIWLPGTSILPSIIATLLMKVIDLLLAYALFKVVHGEVTRYRNTSPDLPRSLRL